MAASLRVLMRVLFAPVWVLWQGYRVLWWAFEGNPRRREDGAATNAPPGSSPADATAPDSLQTDAPKHGEGQNAAFEVTREVCRRPATPTGALRAGFASALIVSALCGWWVLAQDPAMSARAGWAIWAWATLLAAVGSVWVVRHIARRQRAAKPATTLEHARAASMGVKDAVWEAGGTAFGVGAGVWKGCQACYRGARAVMTSRPATLGRSMVASACGKAWRTVARRDRATA